MDVERLFYNKYGFARNYFLDFLKMIYIFQKYVIISLDH